MNSKNLHKHALPIVLVSVAGAIATFGFVASLPNLSGASSSSLGSALTSSIVSITRTKHGFADVQVLPSSTPKAVPTTGLPDIASTESSVGLEMHLQEAQ